MRWYLNSEQLFDSSNGNGPVRMEMNDRSLLLTNLRALLGRGTRSAVSKIGKFDCEKNLCTFFFGRQFTGCALRSPCIDTWAWAMAGPGGCPSQHSWLIGGKCNWKSIDTKIHFNISEMPHVNRQILGAEQIFLEEGDTLDVACRADRGWPRPRFHWYFNDQKVGEGNPCCGKICIIFE